MPSKSYINYNNYSGIPFKLNLWPFLEKYPETLWFIINRFSSDRRKKLFHIKCTNRTLTTAGVEHL